jgi:hypothetical protein
MPIWKHCEKHNIDYPIYYGIFPFFHIVSDDGCPFCTGKANYEYHLRKKAEEKHNKKQKKLAKKFKVGDIVTSSYGCDGYAWDKGEVFKIKEIKRYKDGSVMVVLENQEGAEFYREPQYLTNLKRPKHRLRTPKEVFYTIVLSFKRLYWRLKWHD